MTKAQHIICLSAGAILLAALALFTFGRHTKVIENLKQQTATLMNKEYIPDQHVNLENTLAYQHADSVYQKFRQQFRMHYQPLGTATFADSSRLILISEPAPFFEKDTLEKILKPYTHNTAEKYLKIGYDGRITDLMIVLGNATHTNVDSLVARISRHQYLSDYKPNAVNLLGKEKRAYFTKENLDYQISLGEFDDWFFQAGEQFIDTKDTSKTVTISQMFKHKRRGVFFSKAPGLVAWSIRRNADLIKQVGDIRQFALDADLILGALRDSTTLVIIGREREATLQELPPLRVETVLLIASISSKELSQSLDINDCMAGKMPNGRDWCPTYLSRELENTELGHLLTITDILLKDWSESGTIQEAYYRYPAPGHYPFDKPLFKKLGLDQLVYNWNTANTMYAIDLPAYTIYTLNRTGALPVSYFNSQERSESVGSRYEQQAGNYFARCGNTDIARVVQYTALYQLFMDNGIHYKGKLLHGVFPSNKPYLLSNACHRLLDVLKGISDTQIEQIADSIAHIHFNAFGQKQINMQMRENEQQYNFTYTEDHQKEIYRHANQQQQGYIAGQFREVRSMLQSMSADSYDKLARYISYPRGTTINNQEKYNRMLQAHRVNDLLRTIGKNHLPMIGIDLSKVKDAYVGSLSKSGGRYLKTPSIIITYNDMFTTGGHNISSRITRVSSTSNYKTSSSAAPQRVSSSQPASKPTASKPSTTSQPTSNSKPSSNSGAPSHTSSTTHSTKAPTTTRSSSVPGSGSGRSRSSVIPSTARSTRGY
ncbi:MAG: hypothetical protein MJZ57_05970 [Bacteroidales bacterium]|nr:hypothetical protein [Bacteroidales bacterium]